MRNTVAKKRAGQEDVDSDCLFANVLQCSAFGGRPMVVCFATRAATVALSGDGSCARVPRTVREQRSVVRLGVSAVFLNSRRLLDVIAHAMAT